MHKDSHIEKVDKWEEVVHLKDIEAIFEVNFKVETEISMDLEERFTLHMCQDKGRGLFEWP
jgi:hypothetical protein